MAWCNSSRKFRNHGESYPLKLYKRTQNVKIRVNRGYLLLFSLSFSKYKTKRMMSILATLRRVIFTKDEFGHQNEPPQAHLLPPKKKAY